MTGKVVGIGVGPGDPDLLTIKAAKALASVDVVCVPKARNDKMSTALTMIQPILMERKKQPEVMDLIFPMTKEGPALKRAWATNAKKVAERAKKGKTVAFITLGDPMFYSTFIYLCQNIKNLYPEIPLEIVPGVTSLTACAATCLLPLAEQDEAVVIIPYTFDSVHVGEIAKHANNLVFMKGAPELRDMLEILEKSGFTEDSTVALIQRCTMPGEQVIIGRLGDVKNWKVKDDYFSMTFIKKKQFTGECKK
ncbi:MAG TPA: precorrin-2 C(20)-methyltransferase [Candidatus Sulfotelmatobacter sp.]|nr:precorrin-2 C(20)-methyltransferase [Candidatus Sulfotelmatobacter sp.]